MSIHRITKFAIKQFVNNYPKYDASVIVDTIAEASRCSRNYDVIIGSSSYDMSTDLTPITKTIELAVTQVEPCGNSYRVKRMTTSCISNFCDVLMCLMAVRDDHVDTRSGSNFGEILLCDTLPSMIKRLTFSGKKISISVDLTRDGAILASVLYGVPWNQLCRLFRKKAVILSVE